MIYFKSGDVITGEITLFNKEVFVLKTRYANLRIPATDVRGISFTNSTPTSFGLVLKDGNFFPNAKLESYKDGIYTFSFEHGVVRIENKKIIGSFSTSIKPVKKNLANWNQVFFRLSNEDRFFGKLIKVLDGRYTVETRFGTIVFYEEDLVSIITKGNPSGNMVQFINGFHANRISKFDKEGVVCEIEGGKIFLDNIGYISSINYDRKKKSNAEKTTILLSDDTQLTGELKSISNGILILSMDGRILRIPFNMVVMIRNHALKVSKSKRAMFMGYKTNTWYTTKGMPTPRNGVAAAVVDGKIYVIGGADIRNWDRVSTVEIFDPKTEMWVRGPDMPSRRDSLKAVAVEGKIYAIGGWYSSSWLRTLEILDVNKKVWTKGPNMNNPRSDFGAVVVRNKIYVIGGSTGRENVKELEIYDIKTKEWVRGTPMSEAISGLAAVELDGRIYVFGGADDNNKVSKKAWIYIPELNRWHEIADLPEKRCGAAAVAVNGKIYLIGGKTGIWGNDLKTVFIYDPRTNTWTKGPDLPYPFAYNPAVTVNGIIYVFYSNTTAFIIPDY